MNGCRSQLLPRLLLEVPQAASQTIRFICPTNSAVDFANGYHDATDATSHLTIVVGVNNCCPGVDPGVYPNHGARWAQEVINPVKSQLANISAQVNVIAGMDIEMNFNYSYASRLWLDDYISQSNCTPGLDNTANGCFFDFGNMVVSANGTTCHTFTPTPSPPPPFPTPGPKSDWSGCDAWYVSWGAQRSGQPRFARPLPEIYHGAYVQPPWSSDANARATLSVFSDQQMHAGPMFFAGSLTQRESCDDSCGYGNNYPWEGFQLLSGALASNTTTRLAMFWSTDMYTQPTFTP
jgi:hypothetical protein